MGVEKGGTPPTAPSWEDGAVGHASMGLCLLRQRGAQTVGSPKRLGWMEGMEGLGRMGVGMGWRIGRPFCQATVEGEVYRVEVEKAGFNRAAVEARREEREMMDGGWGGCVSLCGVWIGGRGV